MLDGRPVEFPLQGGDPHLLEAVLAAARGLQMFFRCDGDFLDRMLLAANLDR
jgi:hypothetical protein